MVDTKNGVDKKSAKKWHIAPYFPDREISETFKQYLKLLYTNEEIIKAIIEYVQSKDTNCQGLQAMARQHLNDYNEILLDQEGLIVKELKFICLHDIICKNCFSKCPIEPYKVLETSSAQIKNLKETNTQNPVTPHIFK